MLQLLLFSLIASIQAEIRIGDLTNYYPYTYKTACNGIGGQLLEFNENRNYRVKLRALKDKFGSEKTKLSIHGYTEYFSDILSYIGVSDQIS